MTELKYNENTNQYARTSYHVSEPQFRRTARKTQEAPIQPSSLSNNNNNFRDKLTEIYHKYYYQQTPIVKAGGVIASLILLYLLSGFIFSSKSPSPFFEKFVHETNYIFEEINHMDLPASNSIMQHTVKSRNAANMIQHSPAFEKHGSQIASGLREFGERIMVAGRSLQKMYSKGSAIYKAFDIEIEAMMNELDSNHKRGNARYFKNKINKLTTKVQDYRKFVEKAQSSIQNAEEIRHDTEGYIHDGLREAEKFVDNHGDNTQYSVDITKAKKELDYVSDLLSHLSETAVHLDRLRKILTIYEDKLLDVEAELDDAGKDDDIFEVTREDLKYLKFAVDSLKSCHDRFLKLSD